MKIKFKKIIIIFILGFIFQNRVFGQTVIPTITPPKPTIPCNCLNKPFSDCGNYGFLINVKYRRCYVVNVDDPAQNPDRCILLDDGKYINYISCLSPNPTQGLSVTPTINLNCKCVQGTCNNFCQFQKHQQITYSNQIKCNLINLNNIYINPASISAQIKNNWCRRPLRTKGDSDGNKKVDLKDYFYYVQISYKGKIAEDINLDFNGDGKIDGLDKNIIIKTLKEQLGR